jgi:hypothetical protein
MDCGLHGSSIKREVKKKHISNCRSFSCFPAHVIERDLFSAPAPWTRLLRAMAQQFRFPLSAVFIDCSRRSQSVLKPAKQRLGARGTQRLSSVLRLTLEPECLKNPTSHLQRRSQGMKRTLCRDTQAVCGCRYLASKATLFQTINVIAAILRARVRRAIFGLIPLATRGASNCWKGPGLLAAGVAAL